MVGTIIQGIFVVGPYRTSSALADVLRIAVDVPVDLIPSYDPMDIGDEMVLRLHSPESYGRSHCILDLMELRLKAIPTCTNIMLTLRNRTDLEWMGALIPLVANEKYAEALMKADMFGGTPGGPTAFGAVKHSHHVIAAPARIATIMQTLATAEYLWPSYWHILTQSSASGLLAAYEKGRKALAARDGSWRSASIDVLDAFRNTRWGDILNLHTHSDLYNVIKRVNAAMSCETEHEAGILLSDMERVMVSAGLCSHTWVLSCQQSVRS